MPKPAPLEVWQVDLGMTAKVRPCMILSDYPADDEPALIVSICGQVSKSRVFAGFF
jgi:mRNA-degrading endonuclease toxin of MazEF toxin-antitoxin module